MCIIVMPLSLAVEAVCLKLVICDCSLLSLAVPLKLFYITVLWHARFLLEQIKWWWWWRWWRWWWMWQTDGRTDGRTDRTDTGRQQRPRL